MKNLSMLFSALCGMFLIFHGSPLSAQEFLRDFGTISKEDLDYAQFEADPDAEAVVLFDVGKSHFVSGNVNAFDIEFERHIRIKVLNSAGVRWADENIPYYRESVNMELIKDLEGFTYNFENGKLTKTALDPKLAYDEKVNENWTLKKFAMPDVREGSIIEYRYKLVTPYKFNLRDWDFQHKIPTLYSQYQVSITPFYEYVYILKGAGKFHEQKSYVEKGVAKQYGGATYNEITHFFSMKNIPAFRDEEFITSEEDYMIQLDFQLATVQHLSGAKIDVISTWPKMISTLVKHEDFGKFINKASKATKSLYIGSGLEGMPERERAKAIIDYVKLNYNWNGYYGKYSRKSVKELLTEKTGSVADLNLFMIGLLKAYGLNAEPVILSTRDHGKIPVDYPFDHFFNYVVAMIIIDGKPFLADATEVFIPFDNIPTRCINDKGLIVKDDGVNWVVLASNQISYLNESFSISFSENRDSLICKVGISGNGYDGLNLRKKTEDKEDRIMDMISESKLEYEDSVATRNFEDTSKPYMVSFQAKTRAEHINEKLYISPFLNEPVSENPLKAKKRTFPIDIVYAKRRIYSSEIKIPEGYVLEFAPETLMVSNTLFSIDYKVTQTDTAITVVGVFDLKSPVYKPEHYASLKEAYNKVVKAFNQKLVLAPATAVSSSAGGGG